MQRSLVEVRGLQRSDRTAALDLCAANPAAYVYVAARLAEVDLGHSSDAVLGHYEQGRLTALAWTAANIVPVGCHPHIASQMADRLRGYGRRTSSFFGPASEVNALWREVGPWWAPALDVRPHQPLMVMRASDPVLVASNPQVRVAHRGDLEPLLDASCAMFTEEIGYPPYHDARGLSAYRGIVANLIDRRHSYIIRDGDTVIFKADVGSRALGTCQIQGVWVHPSLRGQGLAVPAMAAAVDLAREHAAPEVSLYVNDYNAAALATYRRVGFTTVGAFMTVLL